MTELLTVERLRVRYYRPLRYWPGFASSNFLEAVSEVSFAIEAGSAFGVVGESGSGKSTLGRALLGLVPIFSGEVRLAGEPLAPGNRDAYKRWCRRVAMTFQDPLGSLSPRLTVRTLLGEPFRIHAISGTDPDAEALRLLRMVGLSEDLAGRFPHELSGGQARRVGIARALALMPLLLIADEPTAGLDVSVQGELLNLLTRLRADLGLTFVLITHNLAAVRLCTERIGVMYLGQIVEERPTEALFESPAHPYTEALLAAMPVADPTRRRVHPALAGEIPSLMRRPSGCEFHTRCPYADERCRTERPEPRRLPTGGMVSCHKPLC
jgi:oligopeptide/dipeptide ABC transporter ATP-binding protein